MTLVKASVLNGIAVFVKVASALVLNKILAIYVGPTGFAIIGQFQNAVSVMVGLAGGVVATGVTKATAQHFDDETRQHTVWQTAIRSSLVSSLIAGAGLLSVGNWLSEWLLHQADMSSIFFWLALTLPAMAASSLLMAIVNGKKEIGIYVATSIFGSLISIPVTGVLTSMFGLYGALVAFTINPAVTLIATAAMVARRDWFRVRFLLGRMNSTALRELAGFGLMGLTTALTVPVTYMVIRDHLATSLGLSAAGYWQASWKISEIFLMLLTTTLTVYYLPRLAEIRGAQDLKAEIVKVYRFVMPIVILGALMIYALRDFIIQTLFTPDFSPMRELFSWQLAGDVIKIGAFVLAYIMLGRAMSKIYAITEVSFCASFLLLTWIFVGRWGLQGVAIAYAVNYSLYWVCMVYLIRHEMSRMVNKVAIVGG